MSVTLVIREETWDELVASLDNPLESAAFLLAGVASGGDGLTLLCRGLRWIPERGYDERARDRLTITSQGFMPSLAAAHSDSAVPVFLHTHPNALPKPSERDDRVDASLRVPAQIRSRQPWYASLILGGTKTVPSFTGRLWSDDGRMRPISRVRVIGRHLQLLVAYGATEDEPDSNVFDRHIRAFGKGGQQVLSRLRVGVVGVGGTGSAIAEQLARLGVGQLVLMDDDKVTKHNITRIHESSHSDVATPKVQVLADAIDRIGLGTEVVTYQVKVTKQDNALALRHLDVIFGCTDDQHGRAILARLAVWYMIPVFDMGFIIDSDDDGLIAGLYGRVTSLLPGQACLLCRERITSAGIRNEGLPPEERDLRAKEGYAPGLDDPPSVGVFTTMTAMFALNVLLEKLFRYSPEAGTSTELLIRLHELKLSRNSLPGNPRHFCGDPSKWGRGDTEPPLGMTW